ncbi:MAG: L-histidine N(alpha)-methyltransferase [Gemmatimonadaceae bacterium]
MREGFVSGPADRMVSDVRRGLQADQKWLPPTYFYDATGSALFERITRTPEYYLTRAERALLEREADSIALAASSRSFAELGAGNAEKSRILIRALRARGLCEAYVPVDVDRATLAETAASLREEFPELDVIPLVADMRRELRIPPAAPRPLLCAFLGSTLGNFSAAESQLLLSRLRGEIGKDGSLLLGADLVKDTATIERAYNDADGLTAQFNLNVLSVLNRELGADFDPAAFEHRAFYEPEHRRIEMHLVSQAKQRVTIPLVGEIELKDGESIRTEISCKYDRESLEEILRESGFVIERWMTDDSRTFALVLARPE